MEATRLIEELAANAWPPYILQDVDGWRLRFTPGVRARRSSSVLPFVDTGASSLDDRMALVEEFYGSRAVPVRYQISPAAMPADLDSVLESRGFAIEAPVDVQIAPIAGVLQRTEHARADVTLNRRPSDRWLQLWTGLFRRGEAETTRRRILDRIAPHAAFALLEVNGEDVAVGMGVLERNWLGVYSMGTKPDARQRGAATAVLRALARWGSARGAGNCYLQVEVENEPAHHLYERAGFTTFYGYHYRTREP